MIKYIGGLVLVLGLISFLIWTGSSDSSRASDEELGNPNLSTLAALVAVSDFYDFGTIPIGGGNVTTTYNLTNSGEEDITIGDATTTCGCTTGEIEGVLFGMHTKLRRPITIAPGASITLTATFDPMAHGPAGVGLAERSLIMKTNSSVTPEVEVRFRAMVTR